MCIYVALVRQSKSDPDFRQTPCQHQNLMFTKLTLLVARAKQQNMYILPWHQDRMQPSACL